MYIFFADDSASRGAREKMGRLVAFGGILIAAEKVRALAQRVDEICTNHGIPAKEEVKWSPRKGSFIADKLHGGQRVACYSEILQSAIDLDCKAVVALCDYEMRNLKPEWGFQRCVEYALERVSNHLVSLKGEAIIIADRPGGGHREADDFLADFSAKLESDYNYMVAEKFSLNMLSAPSHMVRQLQVADLVVAITTAMFAGGDKYASDYFDLVKIMLLRNSFGYIGGTGVKVYPDNLINLYHWVLREDGFSKGAWPAVEVVELPKPGLYKDSDGKQRI